MSTNLTDAIPAAAEYAINGLNPLADTNTMEVLAPATSLVQQLTEVSPPVAMALVMAIMYAFASTQARLNKLLLDVVAVGGAAALYPQLADPGKVGFAAHNPLAAQTVTGALIGTAAIVFSPLVRKVLTRVGALSETQPSTVPVVVQPKDPNAPSTPTPPAPPAA